MALASKEGEVDFQPHADGPTYRTWYKLVGDLDNGKTPVVILHGGPGAGHEYLLPLTDLTTQHRIPILFYDQLGSGRSTHLQEKNGDESFWTEALFCAELDNLLDKLGIRERGFDLNGHSWGGMLGAGYAARHPAGLRKLVLSNTPSSMETWMVGMNKLRSRLPKDVQDTLSRCEREKDFESKEYEAAVEVFYKRHLCIKEPWSAPEVAVALERLGEDPTNYGTICIGELSEIKAPTLLINAVHDEVQDATIKPFFQRIEKVKWIKFDNASHFTHVDQRERYMEHLRDFLVD